MSSAGVDKDGCKRRDCATTIVNRQGLRSWARRFGKAREDGIESGGFAKDSTTIAVKKLREVGLVGPLA